MSIRTCCGSDENKPHDLTCPKLKRHYLVEVSGGRTSAFLADYVRRHEHFKTQHLHFCFANTGKEREETLEFVNRLAHWGIPIVWLEAVINKEMGKGTRHKVVSFETAARNGEPFAEMCAKYGLPSKAYPHCTRELKINVMNSYMKTFADEWIPVVGIRADERHRQQKGWLCPLIDEFPVDKRFIRKWWAQYPNTDLRLTEENGNCDLCWKKSERKKLTILAKDPNVGAFWSDMEEKFGDGGRRNIFNQREKLSIPDLIKKAALGEFKPFTEEAIDSDQMDYEEACRCKST